MRLCIRMLPRSVPFLTKRRYVRPASARRKLQRKKQKPSNIRFHMFSGQTAGVFVFIPSHTAIHCFRNGTQEDRPGQKACLDRPTENAAISPRRKPVRMYQKWIRGSDETDPRIHFKKPADPFLSIAGLISEPSGARQKGAATRAAYPAALSSISALTIVLFASSTS